MNKKIPQTLEDWKSAYAQLHKYHTYHMTRLTNQIKKLNNELGKIKNIGLPIGAKEGENQWINKN